MMTDDERAREIVKWVEQGGAWVDVVDEKRAREIVDARLATGRIYLRVAGFVTVVETDICRDVEFGKAWECRDIEVVATKACDEIAAALREAREEGAKAERRAVKAECARQLGDDDDRWTMALRRIIAVISLREANAIRERGEG